MFFYIMHHARGGLANTVYFQNSVGPAVEAGFDYHVSGRWHANFAFKQSFASTRVSIDHVSIVAKTTLDPIVVGAGIGDRF